MGFASQINSILAKLPKQRQTLLFSATLPPVLSSFSKAALQNPVLFRIEADHTLPPKLKNVFLSIRSDQKIGALLTLVKEEIIPSKEKAIIFCSTRHTAELICELLRFSKVDSAVCYGKMAQAARRESMALFVKGKIQILVVTDLAARGLDLPLLNCVVNFSFPADPKIFLHRVGRVARMDKEGKAYSLIAPDELPYLAEADINFSFGQTGSNKQNEMGKFPEEILSYYVEYCDKAIKRNRDLVSIKTYYVYKGKIINIHEKR